MKIYTKTGDTGETGLFDGTRVPKSDPRVDAYGAVDELNAWLGLARATGVGEDIDAMLDRMQRDLFALGSQLADPRHRIAARVEKTSVGPDDVARLEGWIDALEEGLAPLRRFILAGGSPAGAQLHVARTVCRRAERRIVSLGPDGVSDVIVTYINRLSDLLFVMARAVNDRAAPRDRVVARSAYTTCLRLAREHYENFPVASTLMPAHMRPHIAAVYAFARRADDFADEGEDPPAVRLAKLDDWANRLHAAARGVPIDDGTEAGAIFIALTETMNTCGLDRTLFSDLLSAFRQDVTVTRYETWDALFDYCRRSANPVGRLVLTIAGYRDASLDRASDAVCTALQLTNFWQDLERDWRKGRLYLPLAVVREAGANEADLDRGHISPDWRVALAGASLRTRELFAEGRRVADGVRGRLRWELRATWLGGVRILDALERADFDVFAARPRLRAVDVLPIAWRALWWR